MIVIEKNVGPKIDWELTENKKKGTHTLTLDDELSLVLEKYERDWPVHIDICRNRDGYLVMSTDTSLYYVAEIDIPAAEYVEPEDEEAASEKIPLDIEKVTLTLWAVE